MFHFTLLLTRSANECGEILTGTSLAVQHDLTPMCVIADL